MPQSFNTEKFIKSLRPKIYKKPDCLSLLEASRVLDISKNALLEIIKRDPSFPRPYSRTAGKTATKFIKYGELEVWHNKFKSNNK